MAVPAGADVLGPPDTHAPGADGITAPLRNPVFRRIWLASLVSNLGTLIQGVGVGWAMTQMTASADKVALVQTALGLPVVLISIMAGAFADVHDRRIVALVALGIALAGATILAMLAAFGMLTPNILLVLCFAVGCGTGLMNPAWQTSVSEQVPPHAVPAAVALNGMSFNIARSVGPAIGGMVVATLGTVAAFTLNAFAYLPLMIALFMWNRVASRSHLPPEQLHRAMVSGVRYVANSPPIKIVLVRSMVFGIVGGVVLALMPLVASDLLRSGAGTYGLMFSAFGIGAVIGALNITRIRQRLSTEAAQRMCALLMGASIAVVAVSRSPILTALALLGAGAAWNLAWTLFNIGVQLSVPRWVVGRALASYHAASMGGIAIGSWGWGRLADASGVETSLLVSAVCMLASPMLGTWLRMPHVRAQDEESQLLEDPEVGLPLQGNEGPLVVVIEYRVAPANAREFCKVMEEVQLSRQRNGAYGWSIARDIADPVAWNERYHCPTWHDYLRMRNRPTQAERLLQQQALEFHIGPGSVRVRRLLEGPVDPGTETQRAQFGSHAA
jgi:predicted MFS family arabinose efflux permease